MARALAAASITVEEYELMPPEQSCEIIKQAIILGSDISEHGTRDAADETKDATLNLLLAVKEIEQAHTISAQVVEDNTHVRTNAEELMNLANNLTKIVESLNLSQR